MYMWIGSLYKFREIGGVQLNTGTLGTPVACPLGLFYKKILLCSALVWVLRCEPEKRSLIEFCYVPALGI